MIYKSLYIDTQLKEILRKNNLHWSVHSVFDHFLNLSCGIKIITLAHARMPQYNSISIQNSGHTSFKTLNLLPNEEIYLNGGYLFTRRGDFTLSLSDAVPVKNKYYRGCLRPLLDGPHMAEVIRENLPFLIGWALRNREKPEDRFLWEYLEKRFYIENTAQINNRRHNFDLLILDELLQSIEKNGMDLSAELIGRLSGHGIGLTPAGDDILTGFSAVCSLYADEQSLRKLEQKIQSVCRSKTNLISETYIHNALCGNVPWLIGELIEAISKKDQGSIASSLFRLFSYGATSGSDSAVGIVLGYRVFCLITERCLTRRINRGRM